MRNDARQFAALALTALLVACGGGGGGGGSSPPPPPPPAPATPIPTDLAITAPPAPEEALAQPWTNSAASLAGLSFVWNFGDGSTSAQANPAHAFGAPGSYTVKLTVSNSDGQSREVTRVVDVPRFKPSAGASCSGANGSGWCLLAGARRLATQFDADGRGWFGNELGEIHASSDGGKTWTRLLRQDGGAVLAFQFNSTTVRALTDQGWVWKSVDRGVTWTHTESGLSFSAQDRNRARPSLLAIGDSTVIVDKNWITEDDGKTWRQLPAGLLETSPDGSLWFSRGVAGGNPAADYVAFELLRSRDGGRTLSTVLTTPVLGSLMTVVARSNAQLVVMAPVRTADRRDEFWQWSSSDGGDHWTGEAAPGMPLATPASLTRSYIELYAGASGMDWANTSVGLFRRASASDPWVYVHGTLGGRCPATRPGDASLALACDGGFALTTDGGQTWHAESSNGYVDADQSLIPVEADSPYWWSSRALTRLADGSVVLTFNGTTVVSSDGGAHWRPLLPHLDLRQLWMTDRRNGWAFNGQGDLLRTTDGGRSWAVKKARFVDTTYAPTLSFVDASHGWVKWAEGGLSRTEDGGDTWSTPPSSWPTADIEVYRFFDPLHGFAYRNSGDYDRSEDGGKTWSRVVGDGTGRVLAVAFRSMDLALAASSTGRIMRTGDGGKTWQSIAVPYGLKNVVFVDDNVALALADQATVLRSTDAGRSWAVVKVAGLGDANRLQASSDGSRVWMFDTSARIFLSEDGGLTWKQQDVGRLTPALSRTRFDNSFFRDAQTGWLVDSLGRLWVTDSGGQ